MPMPSTAPMSIWMCRERRDKMEVWIGLGKLAGAVCQIITCALLLIRPLRNAFLGTEAMREGQRCLLRSEVVRIYYRRLPEKRLQEYEYRNLEQCYKAYKALKGNSFVDHIYGEMQEWEII